MVLVEGEGREGGRKGGREEKEKQWGILLCLPSGKLRGFDRASL